MEKKLGLDYVRYWSSNIPFGYGEKSVLKTKVVNAIFSRLETPENLSRIHSVPMIDTYLAGLLEKRSSFSEASAKSGCSGLRSRAGLLMFWRAHGPSLDRRAALCHDALGRFLDHLLQQHPQMRALAVIRRRNVPHAIGMGGELVSIS